MTIIDKIIPKIKYGSYLKKTALSGDNRLIFVAGLQSTGNSIFKLLFSSDVFTKVNNLNSLLLLHNKSL
jgi:hypothetical protein